MSATYNFRSWWRPGLTGLATADADKDGRLRVILELALKRGNTQLTKKQHLVHLAGPSDVTGLDPKAVHKMIPPPDTGDAQPEHAVYIELAAVDLAWRHSPLKNPDTSTSTAMAPWLVLVVGPDEPGELSIVGNELKMGSAVCKAHPIVRPDSLTSEGELPSDWTFENVVGDLTRWAHVQETEAGPVCRILSPARPQARSAILAALVPAWIVDENGKLTPAWVGERQLGRLPVFHSWRFRTGEDGDFRTLASRLKAAKAPAVAQGVPLRFDYVAQPIDPNSDPVGPADLIARGAVVAVDTNDVKLSDFVTLGMQDLLAGHTDDDGRKAPQPPHYGDRLVADVMATNWGANLNTDPRHRVAAGLGSQLVVLERDMLVDAVLNQLGDVNAAAQTVTRAASGLEVARRLWNKRFPSDTDPLGRLQLFGPALRRVYTEDGLLVDLLTQEERGRPLSKALFSTAYRRALRPGTPRVRHVQEGAAKTDAIFREANRCLKKSSPEEHDRICLDQFLRTAPFIIGPEASFDHPQIRVETKRKLRAAVLERWNYFQLDPDKNLPDIKVKQLSQLTLVQLEEVLEHLRDSSAERLLELLLKMDLRAEILERWEAFQQGDPNLPNIEVAKLEEVTIVMLEEALDLLKSNRQDLLPGLLSQWSQDNSRQNDPIDYYEEPIFRPEDRLRCRPVNLDQVAVDLAAAFDPTKPDSWIRRRALGRVNGVEDEGPFEVCTTLNIPAWRLLRDYAPDWLIPGGRDLPDDSVVLMKSNSAFVQAFLVGLNHRLIEELRWRGLPMQRGCTPVRRFWDQVHPITQDPLDDILGLRNWSDDKVLGDSAHAPEGLVGDATILAFKSELFRRFPDTIVYAVDARPNPTEPPNFAENEVPDFSDDGIKKNWPVFQGALGSDLAFFGFSFSIDEARSHWLVVEQAPIGLRFYNEFQGNMGSTTANTLITIRDGANYAAIAVVKRMRVLLRGDRMIEES
jgi:hypothetical protein